MTPNENEARELLAIQYDREEMHHNAQAIREGNVRNFTQIHLIESAIKEALSLRDSEKRRADEAEAELARMREALVAAEKAMDRILPYLIWTVGDESPGHHPTLPSAVGAFKYSLNEEVRKALPTPTERA